MTDGSDIPPGAALRTYLTTVRDVGSRGLASTIVLVLLGAGVESFGVLLLVPFLGILFANTHLPRWATAVLQMTGAKTPGMQLAALLGIAVLLAIVRGVVLWRRDVTLLRLGYSIVDSWRERLVRALARARWAALTQLRRSNIEFAIADQVNRLSLGSDRLLAALSTVLQLAVQFSLAVYLSPMLTLGAAALFLLATPAIGPSLRAARRHGQALTSGGGKRHTALADFLHGMKLAKAHNLEERYAGDYIAVSGQLHARVLSYSNAQILLRNLMQVAVVAGAGALFIFGVEIVGTPAATLSALLVLLTRLANPALNLLQSMQAVAEMLPAMDGLMKLERSLLAGASPELPIASISDRANRLSPAGVDLVDLHFAYASDDREILRGVAATIRPGELVAIVGPSGTGKTTLADLLIGLLEPTAGSILIDGQPLDGADTQRRWREQMAYVPQDPFLFDQSLLENLRWAAPDASEDEVWHALEDAEAALFVRALPDGLATHVGDRGLRLSGGERQRICLARALLRQPRLLLLDEATNALDRPTEMRLLETLRRLGGRLTIIMITHRPPDLAKPDQVLTLKAGRLPREQRRPLSQRQRGLTS